MTTPKPDPVEEIEKRHSEAHPDELLFQLVQGDTIKRTNPHSAVNLNTMATWLVSAGSVRSGHKLKADLEFANNAHPDIAFLLRELKELREAVKWGAKQKYALTGEFLGACIHEGNDDEKHHAQVLLKAITAEKGE